MNADLIQLQAEVRRLAQEVDRLRQAGSAAPVAHEYPDVPPPLAPLPPDLPGFFPKRKGPPDFNKIAFQPGAYLATDGSMTAFAGQEVTVSADTFVWAKWDHQDAVWVLDSVALLWTGGSIPSASTRYVFVPICKITWSSAVSGRIDAVTPYHVGLLTPPAERLPDGEMDYDVLTWDKSGWSGRLPADRTAGWVNEYARGKA